MSSTAFHYSRVSLPIIILNRGTHTVLVCSTISEMSLNFRTLECENVTSTFTYLWVSKVHTLIVHEMSLIWLVMTNTVCSPTQINVRFPSEPLSSKIFHNLIATMFIAISSLIISKMLFLNNCCCIYPLVLGLGTLLVFLFMIVVSKYHKLNYHSYSLAQMGLCWL